VLIDTNVLVYAHNADAPQHLVARALRDSALSGGVRACLTHQILLEFYAIITNPRRVMRPVAASAAREEVRRYLAHSAFRMLYPTEETGAWLIRLLLRVQTRGAKIFDLYAAATMLTHGVTAIATFNVEDFVRIPGIAVYDPGER
jgi:toxin-antitoxin system PIN domain toxin